ncbi:hypothetical protein ABH994_005621 [Bradyrhizobium yuanmingense]
MALVSRRMIKDMTVGNLSPATQPIKSQRGIEA